MAEGYRMTALCARYIRFYRRFVNQSITSDNARLSDVRG